MPEAMNPAKASSDHAAMSAYWRMIDDMLAGTEVMRAAGEAYLPRFPNEAQANYNYRRKNARFTNIIRDVIEGLAAKPFQEEVKLVEGTASPMVQDLVDNIDGAGTHISIFASEVFFNAIAYAVDWIWVDFPRMAPGATLADARRLNVRPYWVRIPASRLIAVHSDIVGGAEVITHVRMLEPSTAYDPATGEEKLTQRVREVTRPKIDNRGVVSYGAPAFVVYEKQKGESGADVWVAVDSGLMGIDVIPLVDCATGRRAAGTRRYSPPLRDAAWTQIEHYQQETNLKSAQELTCFPMLAGNGVEPSESPITVGPSTVLYAPPGETGSGSWNFIEPSATSLRFLADQVEATEKVIRELGRQPLTAQSGNLTVISASAASAKASSAVQAWAINLKDALERALWLTAKWIGDDSDPKVSVFTDFALDPDGDQAPAHLLTMRDKGDLSQQTLWSEMKRRGILSSEFDAKTEADRLIDEMPGDDGPDDIAAAMTPRLPGQQANADTVPPDLAGSQQEVIDA